MLSASGWIDISLPIRHKMVHWPGGPEPKVELISDMNKGDVANVTSIAMSVHTGTHMDAMRHFIADGVTMEAMPLGAVIGPAKLIAVDDPAAIRLEHLRPHDLNPGDRVLFKTANSELRWFGDEFREDYVYIDPEAAKYLVEQGVQTVGVDYLSVAPFFDGVTTHRILLGAGVWIIEGLDFRNVEPGDYELVCLPLNVPGSDGALARAIVRKL
jgi:arylformamidase